MPLPIPRSDEKAAAASAEGVGAVPLLATGSLPVQPTTPLPAPLPLPLGRFNATPRDETTALLLRCCHNRRWAARIADCRPYPDMDALLAAVDEASYDMTPGDLSEALAAETPQLPAPVPSPAASAARGAPLRESSADRRSTLAAHTALRAAHSAYEARFGQPFLIFLDGHSPGERLGQALEGVRSRLGSDPEEERVVAAEELRRLARGRLVQLVAAPRPASGAGRAGAAVPGA
ncbi:2-oxo-4-hydroxy-4-carboxy-5-ureidoimidazoline decarboxylase [Streptomyces ovatisporus]|uniref:2-oxo-4-hydroxy-4-carboxy-5-ureidoimidazoline decarboxylase n=1 Tax=Streptomyces ovatisporus TaxID=1128682 RepID=A0ABV9A2J1_9ACTN